MQVGEFIHPIFWAFSNFVVRLLRNSDRSYGIILAGFLSLGYLCDRGYEVLGGLDSQLRVMYWELSSLTSVFVVPGQRRYRWDVFPSI